MFRHPGNPGLAPPVYRPNSASPVQPRMAPPAYRPQLSPAAATAQPMLAGIQPGRAGSTPPPVYRCPSPAPVVMPKMATSKMASGAGMPTPHNFQQNRAPGAPPPVYRPQSSNGQMKPAVAIRPPAPFAPNRQQAAHRSLAPVVRPVAQPKSIAMPPAAHRPHQVAPHQVAPQRTGVVQRYVKGYNPGTLRSNYKVMKGLSRPQMSIVQQLHDDPVNPYSIDEARAVATKISTSSNPYEWEVESKASYTSTDSNVQSILDNFGEPTTDVIKKYDDLASRVGYDTTHSGGLTSTTLTDLNLFLEAQTPLHFQFNKYLYDAWTGNMDNYSGSKTNIPLYSVMRTGLTHDFKDELLGSGTLNDVLKEVSGRPAEVHHLLYKAKHPGLANNTGNLVLSHRSESEKRSGPGQHELLHKVSSGNDDNKFNVLLSDYTTEYVGHMKRRGILI